MMVVISLKKRESISADSEITLRTTWDFTKEQFCIRFYLLSDAEHLGSHVIKLIFTTLRDGHRLFKKVAFLQES